VLVAVATAQAGDVVLVPDPGYPDYVSGVALAGAQAHPLALPPAAHHQPDLDAVPASVRARVALTLLNYPSNPCAVLERPGTFEQAVAFAHETGSVLMHDLAYGFLAFERPARSVLEVPGAREVAVELWSASKIYGMAGWRVGFCVGNAEIVARVQELLDHGYAGVFSAVQRAAIAALTGPQDSVAEAREVYRARRDRLVSILRAGGAEIAAPEGTFYTWWRLPDGLSAEGLLRERRVAVAPGFGFGALGEGHVRLSLATPDADVDEAARRLAAALTAA
jgi:aminotransferase